MLKHLTSAEVEACNLRNKISNHLINSEQTMNWTDFIGTKTASTFQVTLLTESVT